MTPANDDSGVLEGAEYHGSSVPSGLEAPDPTASGRGRFGRMFPFLPVCDPGEAALEALAAAMDNAPLGAENRNIPAGYTYLGQFIDHDITFDPTSQLQKSNSLSALADFRTPRLDLDSLYGSGPADQPYLYERQDPENRGVKLLVSSNPDGAIPDLPRNDHEVALIGDPRNDENLIIAQLHLLFIRFHNKVVEHVRQQGAGLTGGELFREAQRIVRWHYQWIVVNDFLPRVVGSDTATGHPDERLSYTSKRKPFIPVEFSGAAYRFGHSMVRDSYRLNGTSAGVPIFPPDGPPPGRLAHLGGFRRLPPELVIDWQFFFETGDAELLQFSNTIDRHIALSLSRLPTAVSPVPSLPQLNLRRSRALGLPSGSDIARAMGEDPLTDTCLQLLDATLPDDVHATRDALLSAPPLWYFILVEAETTRKGLRLGPVGGRIVAEVLFCLLESDPESYLTQSPDWTPKVEAVTRGMTLSRAQGGDSFTLSDLVEFVEQASPPG